MAVPSSVMMRRRPSTTIRRNRSGEAMVLNKLGTVEALQLADLAATRGTGRTALPVLVGA
jgi:hypothetical protein